MRGLFIPEITAEMFRNGCLESIETLMAEGKIYDIDYSPWIPVSEGLPEIHNFCQLYLVTYKQGQICTAFYTETNGRSWWSIDGVEAWMPLPKPYQPEVEE